MTSALGDLEPPQAARIKNLGLKKPSLVFICYLAGLYQSKKAAAVTINITANNNRIEPMPHSKNPTTKTTNNKPIEAFKGQAMRRFFLALLIMLSLPGCFDKYKPGDDIVIYFAGSNISQHAYAKGTIIETNGDIAKVSIVSLSGTSDHELWPLLQLGRIHYVPLSMLMASSEGLEKYVAIKDAHDIAKERGRRTPLRMAEANGLAKILRATGSQYEISELLSAADILESHSRNINQSSTQELKPEDLLSAGKSLSKEIAEILKHHKRQKAFSAADESSLDFFIHARLLEKTFSITQSWIKDAELGEVRHRQKLLVDYIRTIMSLTPEYPDGKLYTYLARGRKEITADIDKQVSQKILLRFPLVEFEYKARDNILNDYVAQIEDKLPHPKDDQKSSQIFNESVRKHLSDAVQKEEIRRHNEDAAFFNSAAAGFKKYGRPTLHERHIGLSRYLKERPEGRFSDKARSEIKRIENEWDRQHSINQGKAELAAESIADLMESPGIKIRYRWKATGFTTTSSLTDISFDSSRRKFSGTLISRRPLVHGRREITHTAVEGSIEEIPEKSGATLAFKETKVIKGDPKSYRIGMEWSLKRYNNPVINNNKEYLFDGGATRKTGEVIYGVNVLSR
ncbi:hypothetical protein [Alkalilimnicola sp. S0819]|uniref:hypothetical protein n=1 Tax=Alkalilimnicola sp. S0819 TaxID=2613922 RepID=UPI001262187D|nr:hypothetical protein [Alkalilimnicola sp. S0819]KAB7627830.1 hypothetical protein F3N43_02310 [Alkalilimnicola sp. S0819]MPQ15462.1 hypothetical protein [Alkalilimnicola sp. S0819]